MPGMYTVKLYYGNETASEKISVNYDPRIPISFEVLKSKYDLLKTLESKFSTIATASQQLIDSKEIVEDFQKRIKRANKNNIYKDVLENHKIMITKIEGLLDDLFGKEDERQGITASEFPSTISYLYTARNYVSALQQLPSATEETLINNANTKVGNVILKINEFYTSDWVEYQKSVEHLNLSPFTDIKELEY